MIAQWGMIGTCGGLMTIFIWILVIVGILALLKWLGQTKSTSAPSPEKETALDSTLNGRISLQTYSMSTVCEKRELEWPTRFYRMNFFKILKTLLMRRKPNVSISPSRGASQDPQCR